MTTEMVERTFTVSTPARLSVGNIAGQVKIRPGTDDTITISAVKHLDKGDGKRTEIEIEQAADGSVSVKTRFGEGFWSWLSGSHPCDVDYNIQAPKQCKIKVNGVSNTTALEGFEGDFEINTVSGEVTLNNLVGPAYIHTVSGGVVGGAMTGSVKLNTVSGDIKLTGAHLTAVDASTVSGALYLETELSEGPYRFSSVSGDARLNVPADSRCSAELSTISGEIVTNLPVTSRQRRGGAVVALTNGGGVNVRMSSVSGDLSISTTESVPSVSPELPAAEKVDRSSVLDRIERGELSVDEAINQLRK